MDEDLQRPAQIRHCQPLPVSDQHVSITIMMMGGGGLLVVIFSFNGFTGGQRVFSSSFQIFISNTTYRRTLAVPRR